MERISGPENVRRPGKRVSFETFRRIEGKLAADYLEPEGKLSEIYGGGTATQSRFLLRTGEEKNGPGAARQGDDR